MSLQGEFITQYSTIDSILSNAAQKREIMKALDSFKNKIKVLFTDIDDTLTTHGQLPSQSYEMLWKLHDRGVLIVPVTGRPAGWCEMIARLWPVYAVVGENGAFYFQYKNKKMIRSFAIAETQRLENSKKLKTIEAEVLSQVPGSAVASDQFCRLFDLAIDFCEDVPPLPQKSIQQIVDTFQQHGAIAKVSSIHVNGWFGEYDKKSMCELFYKENFGKPLKDDLDKCAFAGDSPNDEPMFEFFENSFAVANIKQFKDQLQHLPNFVSANEGGEGFVQIGEAILKNL